MSKKLSDTSWVNEPGTTLRLRHKKGRVYLDVLIDDEKQWAEGTVRLSGKDIKGFIAIFEEAKAYRKAKK